MKVEPTKIAIANRGEVAVRIIQACHELGLKTILLHSEADVLSRAYRLSDEQVCIGSSDLKDSYLNIQHVIQGAIKSGARGIHPGFGFLSENSEFARECENHNMVFVGPSPDSIQKMGDKTSAREIAKKIEIPTVPGYQGKDQSMKVLFAESKKIGYPLMVKAAKGGGGRGIKIIRKENEFESIVESAKRESLSAFGSDEVFLEKYLENAKHIEIQIFGDNKGRIFHLYERECSVQRRHQKIIEEATSLSLNEILRGEMAGAAVKLAEAVNYKSAGTVEFLFCDGKYYFMEMNTRLQVEHPVSESVTGLDLVKAQIITAQNKPVSWVQKQIVPRGHSIECRLYAENPYLGGMPSTGLLGTCYFPQGPGRRFDYGFEKGDKITSYYDSMIGKLIVWEENRNKAIDKMLKVLEETIIFGVQTNIPFLKEILNHSEFRAGTMTTQFIENYFAKPLTPINLDDNEKKIAEIIFEKLNSHIPMTDTKGLISLWGSRWRNI